MNFFSNMNKGG